MTTNDNERNPVSVIAEFIREDKEFELWLEGECKKYDGYIILYDHQDIRRDTLAEVLENYRRCKQRIECDNEAQAPELTDEQAQDNSNDND